MVPRELPEAKRTIAPIDPEEDSEAVQEVETLAQIRMQTEDL